MKLGPCVLFTMEELKLSAHAPLRFFSFFFSLSFPPSFSLFLFPLLFLFLFPLSLLLFFLTLLSSKAMEWVKSMEDSSVSMGERKVLLMKATKALKRQLIESMAGFYLFIY